jgi:hypothetical protein
METEKKEPTLEEKTQSMFAIQSALMLYPDLVKLYPQLIGIVDFLDKQIDGYLGDDDKMVVIARKKGRTAALVFNPKIKFSLTNELEIITNSDVNPLMEQYGKDKYKAKLLDLPFVQTLKDRYERMDPAEQGNQTGGIFSMLSSIVPGEQPATDTPPLSIE